MKELKVKRWLLFAGQNYYPAGGILDFKEAFDSLGEALAWLKCSALNANKLDWAQVVPTYKGRVHFFERRGDVWVDELPQGDCECHCGHPLASECGHRFVNGVCLNCQEREDALVNHGNHGGVS